MIGFSKDDILISDSAGFQIAMFHLKGAECKIKPIDSLRWQEENADVGFILDYPPTTSRTFDYKHFKWCLGKTVEMCKFFQDNRKNKDMKLLNVMHGESYETQSKWYEAIKDFDFDGWAIGVKPSADPMLQALSFMFLWEKGEFKKDSCKWLHFFGTSGKHVVPTLIYAASFLPDHIDVSYDSSSYNIGSIYRTYYMPFDIGPHLSFGNKFKLNSGLTKLPCKCPVCENKFRKLLPYGNKGIDNRLCPSCLSLERHRLLWVFLKEKTSFFTEELKLLHIAPEQPFLKKFKKLKNIDYITADLVSPIADVKLDIQNMPFGEGEFNVVFANHVLEHIPDENKAITEVYRVLKKGGWAIMQVPLDVNRKKTYEDSSIKTEAEREKHFGQYDHLRLHGLDFSERLKKGGFEVEIIDLVNEIGKDKADFFRLDLTEKIYLCKK